MATQRCLLVDDDPVGRQVLAALVGRCGFEVRAVATLAAAVAAATEETFAVAVVDRRLPDGDGEDLVARLDAPVVLVTGLLTADVDEAARDAGCALTLEKPVHLARLRRALRDVTSHADPAR